MNTMNLLGLEGWQHRGEIYNGNKKRQEEGKMEQSREGYKVRFEIKIK